MLSTSTRLARSNQYVKLANSNTLRIQVARYRKKRFDAMWFVNSAHRADNWLLETPAEILSFLSFGSPTLRYLLYLIL